MGSMEPFEDNVPLELKLKCLPDEDLLDVWVESQQIEALLDANMPGHDFPGGSFESVIVHELCLRASRKQNISRDGAGK